MSEVYVFSYHRHRYLEPLPPCFPDDVPSLRNQLVLDHLFQLWQHLAGHHSLENTTDTIIYARFISVHFISLNINAPNHYHLQKLKYLYFLRQVQLWLAPADTYPISSTVALSSHGCQLSIKEIPRFVNTLNRKESNIDLEKKTIGTYLTFSDIHVHRVNIKRCQSISNW